MRKYENKEKEECPFLKKPLKSNPSVFAPASREDEQLRLVHQLRATRSGELFDEPAAIDHFPVRCVEAVLVAVRHDDDDGHVAFRVERLPRKVFNFFIKLFES